MPNGKLREERRRYHGASPPLLESAEEGLIAVLQRGNQNPAHCSPDRGPRCRLRRGCIRVG
eukprot:6093448-Prymnesium_polylepis.1